MHVKKTLLFILTISIITMLGCDTSDPVVAPEVGAILLAPGVATDSLVYATAETGEYHLAFCRDSARLDKTVMPMSEAVALGYTGCETCFPMPPEPVEPSVYVLDGDDSYHLAGCPFLDNTMVVTPKADGIDAGYVACPMCSPEEYVPPPLSVYVMPGSTEYHFAFCPDLTDAKELMAKWLALEAGYTPHECAACVVVHGGIVYVTESADEVYHTNRNCKHLDHLSADEKNEIIQPIWTVDRSFRECLDCDEERHIQIP